MKYLNLFGNNIFLCLLCLSLTSNMSDVDNNIEGFVVEFEKLENDIYKVVVDKGSSDGIDRSTFYYKYVMEKDGSLMFIRRTVVGYLKDNIEGKVIDVGEKETILYFKDPGLVSPKKGDMILFYIKK